MQRVLDDYYNEGNISYTCTSWAPVVGFAGIAFAVVFASEYSILFYHSSIHPSNHPSIHPSIDPLIHGPVLL
jgi:hypothetical protein